MKRSELQKLYSTLKRYSYKETSNDEPIIDWEDVEIVFYQIVGEDEEFKW